MLLSAGKTEAAKVSYVRQIISNKYVPFLDAIFQAQIEIVRNS